MQVRSVSKKILVQQARDEPRECFVCILVVRIHRHGISPQPRLRIVSCRGPVNIRKRWVTPVVSHTNNRVRQQTQIETSTPSNQIFTIRVNNTNDGTVRIATCLPSLKSDTLSWAQVTPSDDRYNCHVHCIPMLHRWNFTKLYLCHSSFPLCSKCKSKSQQPWGCLLPPNLTKTATEFIPVTTPRSQSGCE